MFAAGPADEMKAMTFQDLLGDEPKASLNGNMPLVPGSGTSSSSPTAPRQGLSVVSLGDLRTPGGAWSAVKQLASAAAGEAVHLAREAGHMAHEAP